jgi:hypothetical protein
MTAANAEQQAADALAAQRIQAAQEAAAAAQAAADRLAQIKGDQK